jgi:uncharacterized damage-inducible protein DinB
MITIQKQASGLTMELAQRMVKDVGYIPSDKLQWKPTPEAKSAADILAECARANAGIAAVIRGEDPRAAGAGPSAGDLGQSVLETAKQVASAIEALKDQDLERTVTAPWGAQMPMFRFILTAAEHMSYHDGQINCIQYLLGDAKFHWAEG